jgi:hypothetical protein
MATGIRTGGKVRLSPEERAEFKRELPACILLAVLLFVLIAVMLAAVPPVAVQS